MIESIGGAVWASKVSFNGTLACKYYADSLVMAFNKKWWA